MADNLYEQSLCSFYRSSSTTDEQGRTTTNSWQVGYGHEFKDGQVRFFAVPVNGPDLVEVSEQEYKRSRERMQTLLKPIERARQRLRFHTWNYEERDQEYGPEHELQALRRENERLRRLLQRL
jgi:hypothetical protein